MVRAVPSARLVHLLESSNDGTWPCRAPAVRPGERARTVQLGTRPLGTEVSDLTLRRDPDDLPRGGLSRPPSRPLSPEPSRPTNGFPILPGVDSER